MRLVQRSDLTQTVEDGLEVLRIVKEILKVLPPRYNVLLRNAMIRNMYVSLTRDEITLENQQVVESSWRWMRRKSPVLAEHRRNLDRHHASGDFLPPTMSIVLPGEHIPAQHVNLKLGPGLFHDSSVGQEGYIISTRSGDLKHSANKSRWWIESNSRRVRSI